MTAVLRFEDLTIRYPGARSAALQHVSGSIAPGERVALIGPSGAGKSTLLAAASGVIPHAIPAEMLGAVYADGVITSELTVPEISRTVGTVFQDPDAQIVTGSVLDEVCFALENQLFDPADAVAKAREALAKVGLARLLDRHPGTLSGGQRQRLVLACVFAMEPRLLVLDEPTANLDPLMAARVFETLRCTQGQAVLLVEHKLESALSLADRVWELDAQGRLVRDEAVGGEQDKNTAASNTVAREAAQRDTAPRNTTATDSAPGVTVPSTRLTTSLAGSAERTHGAESGTGDDKRAALLESATWHPPHPSTPAVSNASLRAPAGAITALIGENGAGKSTMLYLLGQLIRPSRGAARWITQAGELTTRPPPLGFAFQNPEHQFLGYSVKGELRHALRLSGVRRGDLGARVAALLERFGLTGFAEQNPFLLSGGQKRRLSVAIAMAGDPRLLLLDEPSYGQDPANVALIVGELRKAADGGAIVVMSTHDPEMIERLADHVVRAS